jgi:hypothetical protein
MAIMAAGGVIILILVVWLVTEGPDLLEGAFDTYHAWPHGGARVDETHFPGDDPPEPEAFDLLGNASGWKCIVVVSKAGVVMAYWSGEPLFQNRSEERLDTLEGPTLEGTNVRLGWATDGTAVCRLDHRGNSTYWTFDAGNGAWTLEDGRIRIVGPHEPDIRIEDTPGNWPSHVEETAWDTVTIDGFDVVVGGYSWWGGGDNEAFQMPTIFYRRPSGEWSTKVVLDKDRVYHQNIAGTSMDDIIIVTYGRHGWKLYSVTDDAITTAGDAPPTHGLPRE